MNTEEQFWYAIWKLVALVALSLTATVGGCTAHRDAVIQDLILKGNDPQKVSCVFTSSGHEQLICAQLAAKQ